MNGYTADQPITQIFPTLMSMLLFAFASWMIPKMAASIASGTLGTGARTWWAWARRLAKRLRSARPPLPWSRQPEEPGSGRRRIGGKLKQPVRWEARRPPRALPPLLVGVGEAAVETASAPGAAGSGSGSGWFAQFSSGLGLHVPSGRAI